MKETDALIKKALKYKENGLTDHEIAPPVKWLGLVKVKNEIIVKFGLCFKKYQG